jgi:hypothetical protein
MIRRISMLLTSFVLLGVSAFAQTAQTGTPDGFVPISSLPPGEELPAARFVIAAYAFFLLLMVFYLWTIWRRLDKVEGEMKALQRRSGESAR